MGTVKLGGICFDLDYVLSFETKEGFIESNLDRCSHTEHKEASLKAIWDLAHRNDDFKTANNVNDVVDVVLECEVPNPLVKPIAIKRKAVSKKE